MSDIICNACHQANPGSSKFCNRCGNVLPPPDSIVCPNCNTSNSKKTYYCDECGTRLVTDKLSSSKSSDQAEAKEEASFFSLPIRKPEDVGDLDPADLSSWIQNDADDEDTSDTNQAGTAGLPDWLVNDSDPILDIPEEITTEHYNLLVDTDKHLPELPDQEDVNLPDWLTGGAGDTVQSSAVEDAPTGTAVPDWIPTPVADEDSPKISGQTVTDLTLPESDFDFEDLFDFEDDKPLKTEPSGVEKLVGDDDDWLNELTDGDELFEDETAVSTPEPTADSGELPDWLADDADVTSVTTESALDDDDDWLNDLTDDGDDSFAEKTAVSPSDTLPNSEELPDWLTDDAAVASAVTASASADDNDDDWLSDLIDDSDDLFAEKSADIPSDSDKFPDWLTDDVAVAATITQTDGAPDDEGDWLADLGEGGTDLFDSPVQSETEGSLDWLDDATTASDDFDEELDDLFAGTELLGDEGLDWLTPEENSEPEPLPVDDLFASGAAVAASQAADDLWQDDIDNADLEDEPDWLNEYGTDLLGAENEEEPSVVEEPFEPPPPAEIDDDLEDFFSSTDDTLDDLFGDSATFPTADNTDVPISDEFSLETTTHDISFAAEMLGGDGDGLDWVGDSTANVNDDLPDWLDDLGEADDDADDRDTSSGVEAIAAAAIISNVPEWLADMEPGSDEGEGIASLADTSDLGDDDFNSLTFDEGELSDTGLPEWLHEDVTDDESALTPAVATGLAVAGDMLTDGDIIDDLLDGEDDFTGIDLSDLPPSVPLEDRMSRATIPDWVEEMKPAELTPEGAEPEPEPTPESAGPLVGIGGVIALQSALSPSYDSAPVNKFGVTKEHQQQTALLRQLTQGERKLSSGISKSDAKTSARVRMALIVVLLLVALAGLFGPSLVTLPTEPSPALVAVHDELTAVSNQPVLVAFEYTPAMAGELNATADTLLAALAENGSPVVAVSQSAAGSTIAASHLPEDGVQIGMVTGGAVGLRQLADCVSETSVCATLLGREVTPEEQELLRNVALIIVLTGERDSMVNWIEQVGSPSKLPLVMGLTTSIAPLAAPYYDSGQITGMMDGLEETAVYQQEWQSQSENDYLSRLNAQALLQLTAAILLVVGGIYYGVMQAKKQNEEVGN